MERPVAEFSIVFIAPSVHSITSYLGQILEYERVIRLIDDILGDAMVQVLNEPSFSSAYLA